MLKLCLYFVDLNNFFTVDFIWTGLINKALGTIILEAIYFDTLAKYDLRESMDTWDKIWLLKKGNLGGGGGCWYAVKLYQILWHNVSTIDWHLLLFNKNQFSGEMELFTVSLSQTIPVVIKYISWHDTLCPTTFAIKYFVCH